MHTKALNAIPGSASHPSERDGVSTNGVTANFISFDRGTFWVLPLTYLYVPKSARAYLFPHNLSKVITFAEAPLALTPFVHNHCLYHRV